ncbi:hypothetical protein Gpo141_00000297 [Globisporangium polare]
MATASASLNDFRSPADKKNYRVVTLPNGLEALLIQNEASNAGSDSACDPEAEPEPEAAQPVSSRARRHSFFSTESDSDDGDGDDSDDDDEHEKASTHHAAACMTVGVGSMSDPQDLKGLAHYLEHMLFMGSDKYPDENEFEAFLSTHGGYSNGATECESTRFLFEIGPRHVEKALDMFAQFFIAPLFKQEAMERELLAVESEFNRALQNDYVRLQQIQCETCVPGHAYDTFSWGNTQSLQTIPASKGIDVREAMIDFYKKHYAANAMKLCVYGQDSLDDMEKWVAASFGEIRRGLESASQVPSVCPRASAPPFGIAADQEPTLIKIVPVRKMHSMHLYWPMPPLLTSYRQKPWDYLSHVLGHENDGSLTAALKNRRWATYVSAGISEGDSYEFGSFGSLFEVGITLTRLGLEHWDEVVQVIFDVLHFTKASGELEPWIFDELRASSEMSFLFQEEQEPISLCRRMSHLMQDRHGVSPRGDLLRYDTLQGVFQEEPPRALLDHMTPENTRVLLFSHSFEEVARGSEPLTFTTEKWFGAKYAKSTISEELVAKWRVPSGWAVLKHPSRNRFMPQRFDLEPREPTDDSSTIDNGTDGPQLVCTTRLGKLWFKQDAVFCVPKTNANFLICLPSLTKCVSNYVCATIYLKIVNDALKQTAYQASNANLAFDIGIRDLDIEATFSGFSDKLGDLMNVVFQQLVAAEITPAVFAAMRDELVREYRNLNLKPAMKARYLRLQLLERTAFSVEDKIHVLAEVELEDVAQFRDELMWSGDVALRALIHGNSTRAGAIELQTQVEELLSECIQRPPVPGSPRVRAQSLIPPHTTELPVTMNGILLRDMSEHEEETNSAVEVYYQIGKCGYEDHAYAELLHQLMAEPLFDHLRTRQQLGYEVYCCVRDTHGVLGFSVAVQSASHASGEIAVCIDRFVHADFLEFLTKELSSGQFAAHVATLQRLKARPDTTLADETDRYWEEIQGRRLDFQRESEIVKALGACTLEGLIERYHAWLLSSSEDNGSGREGDEGQSGARKLRVHVVGKSSHFVPLEKLVAEEDAPEIIRNLREFKKALTCHC